MEAEFIYCAYCGQHRIKEKETLGDIWMDFLGDYFAFDSKLSKTIGPLFFRPGYLSIQHRAGKRVTYIPPVRLFIFISIFFFIILNWSGNNTVLNSSTDDARLWNDFFHDYLPKVFFLLLPLFAAIMMVLFKKRKPGYVFNLIIATHYHAFLFILFSVYLLLSTFLASKGFFTLNTILFIITAAWALIYLFVALWRIYSMHWLSTLWRFVTGLLIYSVFIAITMVVILAYITLKS